MLEVFWGLAQRNSAVINWASAGVWSYSFLTECRMQGALPVLVSFSLLIQYLIQ